ncbi:histone H3.v1-like isoform X2 [Apis laboriosa]|uniref:histone H3.v1-like isoform X2 n=1 Tax=Apis laboriosa TaxID=183418 RepID=UPI001CC67B58|nr:histone H3.v1-like isoform X2 [Apis laboriosa]
MELETTRTPEENVNTRSIEMSEKRISMGINVSILVILTIFGVLLSLPLRLLLNTNYYSRDEIVAANEASVRATGNAIVEEEITIPFDHRTLKRCPRFEYENTLKYIFKSDYDGNCTYDTGTNVVTIGNDTVEENTGGGEEEKEEEEKEEEEEEEEGLKEDGNEGRNEDTGAKILREIGKSDNKTDKVEESGEDRRSKSVLVAGHILVTMLLISAIAALVEVLRIRFARDKAGSISSRKTSTIELPIQRRFLPRYPMKSTKSFEMHRSAFRLLGARPPPLIRRSSFPIQQSKQSSGSVSGTPNNRISRRQSAESDEEIGVLINALHHRTRLIRRH